MDRNRPIIYFFLSRGDSGLVIARCRVRHVDPGHVTGSCNPELDCSSAVAAVLPSGGRVAFYVLVPERNYGFQRCETPARFVMNFLTNNRWVSNTNRIKIGVKRNAEAVGDYRRLQLRRHTDVQL
jgi:hypothetical protein